MDCTACMKFSNQNHRLEKNYWTKQPVQLEECELTAGIWQCCEGRHGDGEDPSTWAVNYSSSKVSRSKVHHKLTEVHRVTSHIQIGLERKKTTQADKHSPHQLRKEGSHWCTNRMTSPPQRVYKWWPPQSPD
eukprot:1158164-Pelagomonas_calceolata.AAC.7